MKLSDYVCGMRVLYLPRHAQGNKNHPDCEEGTVSSINDRFVFVRFDKQVMRFGWSGATSQACVPSDLLHTFVVVDPESYFATLCVEVRALREIPKIHDGQDVE